MVWLGVVGLLLGPACGPKAVEPTVDVTAPYQGTWVVSLSDEEHRRLLVYEYALQDDAPGEPELRSQGLTDEDLETLRQLRAMPRDAPQIAGISEILGQMSGSLVITGAEMRMEIGARQETVRWSVVEQAGSTLTVSFEGQGQGTIRMEEDGSLVLVDSQGQELAFVREER